MDPIDIIVEGGVVQEVLNIPKGISVRVIDYDIDTVDEDQLSVSPYGGEACSITDWP